MTRAPHTRRVVGTLAVLLVALGSTLAAASDDTAEQTVTIAVVAPREISIVTDGEPAFTVVFGQDTIQRACGDPETDTFSDPRVSSDPPPGIVSGPPTVLRVRAGTSDAKVQVSRDEVEGSRDDLAGLEVRGYPKFQEGAGFCARGGLTNGLSIGTGFGDIATSSSLRVHAAFRTNGPGVSGGTDAPMVGLRAGFDQEVRFIWEVSGTYGSVGAAATTLPAEVLVAIRFTITDD